MLVVTLLHNIVGSVLCKYLGYYFAAQYCRHRSMQISRSLLCCTILQAAYYVDIFVTTLLYNTVGSVLCRYVGRYFASQYCGLRTMLISWSLLCCTIMQAAYYVDILFITLLHNIVGRVLCRYLDHFFAAQYCRQCTMQIDILVIILLHNTVGSVLCRYFGRFFAAHYCRQRTIQISFYYFAAQYCCTMLQAAYYIHILVITFLHNTVGSVVCRYLGHYFATQYCSQRTMQIYWSLLCCTILQTVYYVYILVVTLLHNNVVSVLCRYLGRYFAAQYCRQSTMQISYSLLCCTIMQAAYYVDILVITLLHYIVGSVLCRYVGRYFAALYCRQYLRQRTMQISWSFLCCTILQAAFYVDILVITLLHNIVGNVLCRYLGHYFAAQYSRQCTMQISWSLLCYIILQAAYYVHILVVTLLNNSVRSILCRYLDQYFAVQYCLQCTMLISWSRLCCTILQRAYLCRYLCHYFAAQ